MSAPLCTVTPLEALRRLYDVARKVDAHESGEFETLLQGELAVAAAVLAAPVVPVAAQPVVPEGWKLVPEAPTPKMVDATWNDSLDGMSHNARNKKIYGAMLAAAPQPAASVADAELLALLPGPYYMDPPDGGDVTVLEQLQRMAKNAERYDFMRQRAVSDLYIMDCSKCHELENGMQLDGDTLDKFIDAAIAAQQGEKTK